MSPLAPNTQLIYAPWTQWQVDALNAWQQAGHVHPFTCALTGDSLVATKAGWVCPSPACLYVQNWAHAFMAEPGAIEAWHAMFHADGIAHDPNKP